MNDAAAQRWPPWYGPLALFVGLVIGLFGGVVVQLLAHAGGSSLNNVSPGQTDVETIVQDLGFVVAAVYLAAHVGPVHASQFGLVAGRPLWRSIGLVIGGLVVFYLLSYAWFSALHSSGAEKNLVKDLGGGSGTLGILGALLVTCVVAPICEEFLFRGFIFRALRNWRGVWPAAAITGILFGLVHGLSAPAIDLLPLALLGFVLCLVYDWAGSLYPCIVLHVLNNAIAFGSNEHWTLRIVEAAVGSLAVVALVLALVHLASTRWTPASD